MSELKLDLGCGPTVREGYVGIDINPGCHPHVVMDLDTESLVDRFGENSVDAIFTSHFLEHSTDLIRILTEMWKVSKPGAIWEVNVPPGDIEAELGNPFHRFRFTPWTFRFFDVGGFPHAPTDLHIGYGVTDSHCLVRLREIQQRQTSPINLSFTLEVIKS